MICGIVAGQGGTGVCSHPLDATLAQILAQGLDGKLTMDVSEQIGTYTIQSGLSASETYGAGSLSPLDYTTGIKASEYVFAMPMITGGAGSNIIEATASLDENPFSGSAPIRIKVFSVDDGTFSAAVLVDNATVCTTTCNASSRFTVIANGTTGALIVKLDGVALTLSDPVFVTQDVLMTCSVSEEAGLSVAYQGETVTIQTITDSYQMLHASGHSATDICGNPA